MLLSLLSEVTLIGAPVDQTMKGMGFASFSKISKKRN